MTVDGGCSLRSWPVDAVLGCSCKSEELSVVTIDYDQQRLQTAALASKDSGCGLISGKDGLTWWWQGSYEENGEEMENKCKGKRYKQEKPF